MAAVATRRSIGAGPQSIQSGAEDHAENPGLSIEQLARFLRDIDYQPAWRANADRAADYADGLQYDAKTLQDMEEKGIPPIVVDLISPTIRLIDGMREKTLTDLVVRADDEDATDFAEAMTKKLQEAERETNFDAACLEAGRHQVRVGIGWVHPRRQRLDPFGYPYAVEFVHRREIWWDWQDTSMDLSRARWLVRRKWYDFDYLAHMFPRFKRLIAQIESGWDSFDMRAEIDVADPLYQNWLTEREFLFDLDTWRNLERKQAMVYEVWYRVPRWAYVLHFPNGLKVEYDEKNPAHKIAIVGGHAEVDYVPLLDTRLSWWIGPHRLIDKPTPLPHNQFPYVPFWGYREDRTGVPYGQVRNMMPLQDEVNARRARMLWQLSARRIIGFDDAVMDKRAVEAEAARPDAAIWLNSKVRGTRSIEQLLRIDESIGLNAQQIEAYRDAAERLQDVASVFKEQLGKAGAADSGVAIRQLIEQGTTALASLNANFTFARQMAGNQLFALLKEDIGDKPMEVVVTRGAISKKRVKLNEPTVDEVTGTKKLNNSVRLTRAKVVIDDVPSSATFREYQFKELTDLVKQLPPELQAPMLDMVVQASDAPYKEEIVRRIRETLGIREMDPENMSPEEQAALQEKLQVEEMLQRLEQALQQLAVERADLENRKIDAETELAEAQTEKTKVETARLIREPIRDPNAPPAKAAGKPKSQPPSRSA